MKIKKSQLQKILTEEITNILLEQGSRIGDVDFPHQDPQAYAAHDHLRRQREIEDTIQADREYGEQQYRAATEFTGSHTLSADTTPRDYEGLERFTQAVVPFGETATTLLDPRQEGFPSREQVISDVGWETAGAALPFIPGQKLRRGWEWIRSRLPSRRAPESRQLTSDPTAGRLSIASPGSGAPITRGRGGGQSSQGGQLTIAGRYADEPATEGAL